jgi:hypothetical protein
MDDSVMRASGTMSVADIQAFFVSKGSSLANFSAIEDCASGPRYSTYSSYYSTYFSCGNTRSAAQIVYDAAQAWGINPQTILSTMQKEESLITSPNPTASQLNYAMGYGCPDSSGCAGYSGFFNQVDWATWQFRADMELGGGNSFWGWSPSSYPCNGATQYYDKALKPGNDVTFIDDYGSPYTHFIIPNLATAALYCYTPHVYPGSSREYFSGSYWFVYYYNLWFVPYAWNLAGQAGFVDSSRTQPFSRGGRISIAPGGKAYMRIQARNSGYQSWPQNVVRLGTTSPQDRCSPFADATWSGCQRMPMVNSSVAPGEIATFDFTFTAPPTTGSYKECFNVVADGVTWLNDQGVCFAIDVVAPIAPASSIVNVLNPGQSIGLGQYLVSSDTHSAFSLLNNGNLSLLIDYKTAWSTGPNSNANRLYMQTDGNLVLYTKDMKPLWASGTDGNPNSHLVIQSDGNAVIYSSAGLPLWSTRTDGSPEGYNYINHFLSSTLIYPMQELRTADGRHRMLFQADGNLVLYSSGKAVWASGTDGKPVSFMALQEDGNLVIYDHSLKPLWASGTDGQGRSRLFMQDDGNLVLYNSINQPTWNSGTSGR